jgi:hypothetical protein
MPLFRLTLFSARLLAGLVAGLLTAAPAHAQSATGIPLALSGPEQRIALVIGNSKYQNTVQLSNPGNDTKAVAQLLNAAGFEVISATDLGHNQMIEAVQAFSARIAGRGPNTVAMVYYAGHGVQLAGENYLVPVDAKVASEPDLISGSLRLVDVMATLEAIPSRVRIVILDACRNNPFPSINDGGRGLAIVDAPKGSIVAYSTAPGTEALDGTGDHSPYTAAFLRLANEKNLPIEQLFKRIRLDVGSSTDGQQTPWESSSLTSDFYFFGDTAVAATRAPAQIRTAYSAGDLPSRSPRQAYEYVLAENSVENYQEFIRIYPHDPLSDRIRTLLGNLLQAKAWHTAVQANSPSAYKSFYEQFSNGPYAQSALKMAAQPKIIPLSQPTRILAPAPIKVGGVGPARDRFGGTPTQGMAQGGGRIVTLPSPGASTARGKSGADTGKIANLGIGRIGERPEKRSAKSSPLLGVQKEPAGVAGASNGRRVAMSSQFRGSFGQAPAGGGVKMMR